MWVYSTQHLRWIRRMLIAVMNIILLLLKYAVILEVLFGCCLFPDMLVLSAAVLLIVDISVGVFF